MKEYRKQHQNQSITTPGGSLLEVCGKKDHAHCSIALVEMDRGNKGIKHYHDNLTEIYLFAQGEGKISINEHEHLIEPGDIYVIEKNNAHLIETITPMNFCCVCTPYWEVEHEFEVTDHPGQDIQPFEISGVIQRDCVMIERVIINDEYRVNGNAFMYCLKGRGLMDSEVGAIPLNIADGYEITCPVKISTLGQMEIVLIHHYRK